MSSQERLAEDAEIASIVSLARVLAVGHTKYCSEAVSRTKGRCKWLIAFTMKRLRYTDDAIREAVDMYNIGHYLYVREPDEQEEIMLRIMESNFKESDNE